MKKLKSLFAKNPGTGRRNKKVLFLSIVALVEVIILMVVSTSAWIETVSSIKIYTTAIDTDGGTKGVIETHLNQRVSVSDSGSAIDLTKFFRNSGDYHLAPASSADGENFYFPEKNGGDTTNFRYGDISDKNVNYVSFTVKVSTANYFAFKQVPTVKIGGTTVSNDLVRFSIGYRATASATADFKVFGMTEDTTNVVNSADGSTGPTYVRAFEDYVTGKNNLVCTTAANSFLTVSMWIQDPFFTNNLRNKTVTVENFELVPVHEFKLYAVTNNANPTDTTKNQRGGTVAIGDGDFGRSVTGYYAYGTKLTIKANPNVTDLFQFAGWATAYNTSASIAASSCTKTGNMYTYEYTFSSGTSALYAKFTDLHELYFKPEVKHPDITNSASTGTYAMYIWQWDPTLNEGAGGTKKEWHVLQYTTSGTWNGYYKGEYNGNSTNVIFAYLNPNYRYSDGTYTVGPSGKTIVYLNNITESAAFDNYRYWQTYDLVFPPELGEYAYRATARRTHTTSDTLPCDQAYVMGYWEDCYSRVYAKAGTGGNVDAYLSYSSTSETTLTRFPTPRTVESSQYYVTLDGRTYEGVANGVTYPTHYDRYVTLVASATSSYNFDGWYDEDGTKVSSDATYKVQAPLNSTTRGTRTNPTVSSAVYEARFTVKPESWLIKYGSSNSGSWGGNITLTRESATSNYFTGTKDFSEGEAIYFKAYDEVNDKWYGNGGSYEGYISDTILSNGTLTTTGNNMYIKAHKGTYTFRFNYSSKQLTITASYGTVRIWLTGSSSFNISNSSPTIKLACSQGTTYMTKSGYSYFADVKSTWTQNIWFNRINPNDSSDTWNSWSAGYRGYSLTYTPTAWGNSSGSGGAGGWS